MAGYNRENPGVLKVLIDDERDVELDGNDLSTMTTIMS